MSIAALALGLARVLPPSPATLFCRTIVLLYLGLRADYRREIRVNLESFGVKAGHWFWVRNGWYVGRNLALMAQVGTKRGKVIVDRAEIIGENISRDFLEQDVHTVMASFHFGAWEYLPRAFSRAGFAVTVLTGAHRDGRWARALARLRSGAGVKVVHGLKELLRSGSGTLGFMLDNTSQGARVEPEFDSVRFAMPASPFRCGHGLVPAFACFRRGRLRVRVYAAGDETAVLRALVEQVRARPEEWIWWGKAGAVRSRG